MAELVLGALGVVPLVSLAFESGAALRSKLNAFRNYSGDLRKVHRRFKREHNILVRECSLLLRLAIDNKVANAMELDLNHDGWSDPKLGCDLKCNLGKYYNDCVESINDVNESLTELDRQLQCFTVLTQARKEEERLSDTVRRLRKKIQLSFSMDKFDDTYKELKVSNQSLITLREQLHQLQQPAKPTKYDSQRHRYGDWGALCKVRQISKALHSGLQDIWSCTEPTHATHSIKIFLEAQKMEQSKNTLQLEIAIIAGDILTNCMSGVAHLVVQSQDLQWDDQPLTNTLPSPPSDDNGSYKRRKCHEKVTFAEGTRGAIPVSTGPSLGAETSTTVSCDLKTSNDTCLDLSRTTPTMNGSSTLCLGHCDVESDQRLRCSFYPAACAKECIWKTDGSYPLSSILNESAVEFVSFLDRLKVARSIATAALTHHSTPWLKELWRLSDLSFLTKDGEISSALRTLHVAANLEGKGNFMQGVMTPNSTGFSQATEDQLLMAGINNTSLWSLGVALIGIDKWEDFDPSDLLVVRKAARNSNFSEKYRDIIQRCLGCSFGHSYDMEEPKLQRAVYMSVVGSLEDMIAGLDTNDDGDSSG